MQLNIGIRELGLGSNINGIVVPTHLRERVTVGLDWFDEVFINGLVPSQTLLFTGTPGAGKTTAAMTIANELTGAGHVCLYNSCEESGYQLKLTAERCGFAHGFIFGQDDMVDAIVAHAQHLIDNMVQPGKHLFIMCDSLPTLNDGKYGEHINSMTGLRVTEALVNFCKDGYNGVHPILVLIGHVTKGGIFAGKNSIKHAVDTHAHLYIVKEKRDENYGEHILEVQKSRYNPAGTRIIVGLRSTGIYKKAEYDWV